MDTTQIQSKSQDQIVEDALERLKRKLLDLSRRNSLLNYKPAKRSIRIVDQLPDVIFDELVTKGKSILLTPLPDPDPETEEEREKEKVQKHPLFDVLNYDEGETKGEVQFQSCGSGKEVDANYELPTVSSIYPEEHIGNKFQTDLVSQVLERRCKKLSADCRRSIEESGINIFFLTIGFLEWYEDDSSDVKNCTSLSYPH